MGVPVVRPSKTSRQDFYLVTLPPLAHEAVLTRFPPVKPVLKPGFIHGDVGRAAIDHDTNGLAMAFPQVENLNTLPKLLYDMSVFQLTAHHGQIKFQSGFRSTAAFHPALSRARSNIIPSRFLTLS